MGGGAQRPLLNTSSPFTAAHPCVLTRHVCAKQEYLQGPTRSSANLAFLFCSASGWETECCMKITHSYGDSHIQVQWIIIDKSTEQRSIGNLSRRSSPTSFFTDFRRAHTCARVGWTDCTKTNCAMLDESEKTQEHLKNSKHKQFFINDGNIKLFAPQSQNFSTFLVPTAAGLSGDIFLSSFENLDKIHRTAGQVYPAMTITSPPLVRGEASRTNEYNLFLRHLGSLKDTRSPRVRVCSLVVEMGAGLRELQTGLTKENATTKFKRAQLVVRRCIIHLTRKQTSWDIKEPHVSFLLKFNIYTKKTKPWVDIGCSFFDRCVAHWLVPARIGCESRVRLTRCTGFLLRSAQGICRSSLLHSYRQRSNQRHEIANGKGTEMLGSSVSDFPEPQLGSNNVIYFSSNQAKLLSAEKKRDHFADARCVCCFRPVDAHHMLSVFLQCDWVLVPSRLKFRFARAECGTRTQRNLVGPWFPSEINGGPNRGRLTVPGVCNLW